MIASELNTKHLDVNCAKLVIIDKNAYLRKLIKKNNYLSKLYAMKETNWRLFRNDSR
jgi:hypothetical protein